MRKPFISRFLASMSLLFASFCFVMAFSVALPTYAQSVPVPENSKFVLNLDFQALQSTKIGGLLMAAMRESFEEEMQKSTRKFMLKGPKSVAEALKPGDKEFNLEQLTKMLGMNPLNEIQQLTISADDFEHPEQSMLAQIRLRKNPGNIEGLLVNAPGYESSEVDGLTIHSASPDDDYQVFGCLREGKDGNYTFYLSATREILLRTVKNVAANTNPMRQMALDDDRKVFLSLQITELPNIDLGEGPQANIAKMLKGMSVSISEDSENLELRSTLQAATQKKAQQLRQAIQGLVAMFELVASMDESDDVQQVLEQVKKLSVAQDDTKVRVKWSVPSEQVVRMLEEEMKDRR